MKILYDLAKEKNAKIIIVQISKQKKLLYKNGKIYIIKDGFGTSPLVKLWPREIQEIKKKIEHGEYYLK